MAAAFEHMAERVDVVAQVGGRVRERMAHARLGRQMHDVGEAALAEQAGGGVRIGQVHPLEREVRGALQRGEARLLERDVVVRVEVVHARDARAAREQRPRGMHADEACGAGYEDVHDARLIPCVAGCALRASAISRT